jgi:hypothetical protein
VKVGSRSRAVKHLHNHNPSQSCQPIQPHSTQPRFASRVKPSISSLRISAHGQLKLYGAFPVLHLLSHAPSTPHILSSALYISNRSVVVGHDVGREPPLPTPVLFCPFLSHSLHCIYNTHASRRCTFSCATPQVPSWITEVCVSTFFYLTLISL